MCVLMPEIATIEEVVVILNPIYSNYYEAAKKLLERMGFMTIQHKLVHLSVEDAEALFKERLPPGYQS
jgi:hypothetical protein